MVNKAEIQADIVPLQMASAKREPGTQAGVLKPVLCDFLHNLYRLSEIIA